MVAGQSLPAGKVQDIRAFAAQVRSKGDWINRGKPMGAQAINSMLTERA